MEKIIINDYIQGDPLSEENLDKTLEYVYEFRLLSTKKSIWVYTGYMLSSCKYFDNTIFTFNPSCYKPNPLNGEYVKVDEKSYFIKQDKKRIEILKNIDVLIDGKYIDSQRNPSKKWAGSDNQRIISIPESLKQGKVVLYCD